MQNHSLQPKRMKKSSSVTQIHIYQIHTQIYTKSQFATQMYEKIIVCDSNSCKMYRLQPKCMEKSLSVTQIHAKSQFAIQTYEQIIVCDSDSYKIHHL